VHERRKWIKRDLRLLKRKKGVQEQIKTPLKKKEEGSLGEYSSTERRVTVLAREGCQGGEKNSCAGGKLERLDIRGTGGEKEKTWGESNHSFGRKDDLEEKEEVLREDSSGETSRQRRRREGATLELRKIAKKHSGRPRKARGSDSKGELGQKKGRENLGRDVQPWGVLRDQINERWKNRKGGRTKKGDHDGSRKVSRNFSCPKKARGKAFKKEGYS